ncbi:MAG: carboxylate-amine ligase [Solirubrobacterales bacterium]
MSAVGMALVERRAGSGSTGNSPSVAREDAVIDHNFSGTPFTVGVEEELMIVDPESMDLVSEIEALLDAIPPGRPGMVKPELMESVLEIATDPCADIGEVDTQLRGLRRDVTAAAGERGMAIGSSGTHPFARWEDQRIVARPRYRDLVSALRFVARQELIFGVHVHVGIDDPDTAVSVCDGMREHLPMLLALSANSPLWRGHATGMMSTRTPIFRQFPRVGIPRAFGDYAGFSALVEEMMEARMIPDYTYLWWDVRPHPQLGTVEVRILDAQTRVEHTVALAAMVQALVHRLATEYRDGTAPQGQARELIDENKVLAAIHGTDAELLDPHTRERIRIKDRARRLIDELADHAVELGSERELQGITDLLDNGVGARRQLTVFEANQDMRELVRELVEVTGQVER